MAHNSYRLFLLAFISSCMLLLYGFVVTFTLALKFCWMPSEFWFTQEELYSPYTLISIILLLLFIWAACEFFVCYKSIKTLWVNLVFIVLIVVLQSSMSVVHYRLFQTLQATNGEIFFYDIWPDTRLFVPVVIKDIDGIGLWEYLYKESCASGLHPSELSFEQKEALYQSYDEINQSKFNYKGS